MTGPRIGARLWWGALPLVILLWGTGALIVSAIPGLPETPLVTLLAVPGLGFARDIAIAILIGALAVRVLEPSAQTRAWALGWGATAIGIVAMSLVALRADVTATELLGSIDEVSIAQIVSDTVAGRALILQGVGIMVALLLAFIPSQAGRVAALVGALAAAVPPSFSGHAGLSGQHSVAALSIALHVASICLWVGTLAVVVALLVRDARLAPTLLPRFSVLALVSVIVAGESGLLSASLTSESLTSLLGTAYGSLVLAKCVLFAWLVRLGWEQRRRAIDHLPESGVVRTVAAIASIEFLAMGTAIAAAVVLARIGPSPIPGEGFAPLTLVMLALAAPAVLVAIVPRGWRVSDALPEAAAFVALLAIIEVGGVGLLRDLLGPIGLVLEIALLLFTGWAAVAASRHSTGGLLILAIGTPMALAVTTLMTHRPGALQMAVASAVIAEVVLAALWLQRQQAATAPRTVAVAE